MKVIIAGGRDIEDYSLLRRVIEASGFHITEVISGMARGVDKMGIQWAKEVGLPVLKFSADWNRYGKAAGPIRNIAMSKVGGCPNSNP